MTKVTDLPRPIIDIIDVFIEEKFNSLTLKELSDKLNTDSSAINQRILRDKDLLFVSNGKPKKIQLKKGFDDLIFYKYKNMCIRCREKRSSEELTVQKLYLDIDKPDHYSNLIPWCKNCLKEPIKKHSILLNPEELGIPVNKKWEYKTIRIHEEKVYKSNEIHPLYSYYKFRELSDINEKYMEYKWYHLRENNETNEIGPRCIDEILDVFGIHGWELMHFHERGNSEFGSGEFQALFKREII
ncbi:MAG: hypothetical protein GY870_04045 [archaeon]|nr:hypothetical protein [archaeon]